MIVDVEDGGSANELKDLVDDIHCRFPTIDVISTILKHTRHRLRNPYLSEYMRDLLSDYEKHLVGEYTRFLEIEDD